MGCICRSSSQVSNSSQRSSSFVNFPSVHFAPTDIIKIDSYFSNIKLRLSEILPKLKTLQIIKSHFYHALHLPSLFVSPNSNLAIVSLILYLIASGNKIEFLDSCPYLEVQTNIEMFKLYLDYVESLHYNIVSLTTLKPELQEYISKSMEYIQKISRIADEDGLDLDQKLNSIMILMNNCKVLWNLPEILEERLWKVKKDLMELKDGIHYSIHLSLKFSILHGTSEGIGFEETIRNIWHEPEELRV